jgi:DNA-binding HxlR family transcriptional regulator
MQTKRMNWKTGCSVEVTLSILGGVWKPVIVAHLLNGKRRFGELSRLVPGATQRMLTLQLRELERDGIISRTVYAEVPPRVEYEITEFGATLSPILDAMAAWGDTFKGRCARLRAEQPEKANAA